MASNIFLLINSQDGGAVQGESVVADYKNQIEVTGVQWGVSQTGSAHSGSGGSTGTATVDDITITAVVDKSFPILAQMAHTGAHVANSTLTICKTTGKASAVSGRQNDRRARLEGLAQRDHARRGNVHSHDAREPELRASGVRLHAADRGGQGGAAVTGKLDIVGNA